MQHITNMGKLKPSFDKLYDLRHWFSFIELRVLVAFLFLWFAVSGFFEIADDVGEGDTHAIDTKLLMMLRDGNDPKNAWGPPWFEEMVRDVSSLGGIAILTLVTLSAALYLAMKKNGGQALYLLATIGVGTLLSNLLKYNFARPRPDLVPHGSYVMTDSFPSGHSMMAALVYLTIGMLVARTQKDRNMKLYFIVVAVVVTMMVGVSRVYLGVHWPSDVLAGWAAGASCALLFWLLEWSWQEKIISRVKDKIKRLS